MNFKIQQNMPSRQAGAVLITSLVLMIVFTMLGVATMRTNITDITVQDGIKNRNNAFQCAEAALRSGEIWLGDLSGPALSVESNPSQSNSEVWEANLTAIRNPSLQLDGLWADDTKTWSYGAALINANANIGCKKNPRYFIETLGAVSSASDSLDYESMAKGKSAMYRVTSYSTGMDDNATVVLQTTYLQPIN
jgi:type IV pilus assembly protein PilX